MGEVYRARDSRLGRHVAIKVLRADRTGDEARRRRFVQEARTASALNHPHIATIYDLSSADGIDFIVMEYVDGPPLSTLVRSGMRMDEVLRVAIDVADALSRGSSKRPPPSTPRTTPPPRASRRRPQRRRWPVRPATCRQSRPPADRSTRAATSSASARCSTRW
jgi:serine/threonine protein kinase